MNPPPIGGTPVVLNAVVGTPVAGIPVVIAVVNPTGGNPVENAVEGIPAGGNPTPKPVVAGPVVVVVVVVCVYPFALGNPIFGLIPAPIFPIPELKAPKLPPMNGDELGILGGLNPVNPTFGTATEGVNPIEGTPPEGLNPKFETPLTAGIPTPRGATLPTPIGVVPIEETLTVETGGIPTGTRLPTNVDWGTNPPTPEPARGKEAIGKVEAMALFKTWVGPVVTWVVS